MNNLQVSAILQKELAEYSKEFEDTLKMGLNFDYNTSLKDYEKRLNIALDLQYKASYIVSIICRMLHVNKGNIRAGGSDILKHKNDKDTLQEWLSYYKNHVYTFTSMSKTLSDFCKTKQMASPDIYRES